MPLVPECLAAAPSSPRYPRGLSYTPNSLRRAPRTASAFWVTPASAVATDFAGCARPKQGLALASPISHSRTEFSLSLLVVNLVKPILRDPLVNWKLPLYGTWHRLFGTGFNKHPSPLPITIGQNGREHQPRVDYESPQKKCPTPRSLSPVLTAPLINSKHTMSEH